MPSKKRDSSDAARAMCSLCAVALFLAACRCDRPTPGGGPPRGNEASVSPTAQPSDSGIAAAIPDVASVSASCAVLPAAGVEVSGHLGAPKAMSIAINDSTGLLVLESEEGADQDGNVGRVVYTTTLATDLGASLTVSAETRAVSNGDQDPAAADTPTDADGGAPYVQSWGVATQFENEPGVWTYVAQAGEEGAGIYGLRGVTRPLQSSEGIFNEGGSMAASSRSRYMLAAMVGRIIEEEAENPSANTVSSDAGDDGSAAGATAGSATSDATDGGATAAATATDSGVAPRRGKMTVLSVLYDGRRFHYHNVYTPRGSSRYDEPDSPAVAVGATKSAIMFRASRRLWIAPIGGDGYVAARLHNIVTGEVGPPSIAYRGDTLYAVWAQRETPRGPASLRWVSWNPFTDPDPTPQVLTVGTASATSPSLVVTNDRFVLAWAEGDAQTSVVRVASTTGDFASLAARAVTVSPSGVDARNPALGANASGSRVVLGWQSRAGANQPNAVRVASLSCP